MSKPIFAIVLICVWASNSGAQGTTGSFSGTVRDSQRGAVGGATVRVLNEETGIARTVVADSAGRYRAPSLAPGTYTVSAGRQGLQTVERGGVALDVAQDVVVNFELSLTGGGSAIVTGSGESTQNSVMDSRSIRDLPLASRSYTALIPLELGVIAYPPGSGVSFEFSAGQRFSADGGRGYTNSFLLDGTDINDHANGTPGNASGRNPGIESVREFTVLTGAYKAEYGRASGAIVSAVTRSGSNQLHGSAYGFHLNSALSARNFFDFGDPQPFRSTQFGGTLGGPIRKDHTFLFGNYEGWRQGLGFTFISFVPDANARQGLLGGGSGFLVNVGVAPAVRPFLALFPLPNARAFGDGVAEFIDYPTLTNNGNYVLDRVDHQFGEKVNLFGRYAVDDDSQVSPTATPIFQNTLSARRQYSTIQLTHVLRPSLLNSFRFAYNRTAQRFDSLPRFPLGPETSFVPGQPIGSLSVAGISSFGTSTNAPRWWIFNSFQWGDDLSYTRGNHALKFGGNIERIRDNAAENTFRRGSFTFNSLANFLGGRPSTFTAAAPGSDASREFRQTLFAAYGQDDIKLASRLILNLGLRWEAVTDPTEARGKSAILLTHNVFGFQVPDSTPTLRDTFFTVAKKNFEPRAGLALQITDKAVLRTGAGIYHDQLLPFVYGRTTFTARPFFALAQVSNPPFPFGGVAPSSLSIPSGTTMAWQDQTPTKYQYDIAFEQQLWKSTVVELDYIGSQARHLWGNAQRNTAIPLVLSGGTRFFPAGAPRLNSAIGPIQVIETDYNASYNAFQVSVRRTSASGLQFQTSYTFSKSLDDSTSLGTGDVANERPSLMDPDDRRRDRGLSAFDTRHHTVFYASYPFPFHSSYRPLAMVIQGWKVNAIGTFNSGRPFTVLTGFNRSRNLDPNVADRPDLVAGASNPVLGGPDRYFDPTAFRLPAAGFYGNLGRNTLSGLGFSDLDFSVEKAFAVRENLTVQFRTEFFNGTNHTNFGLPFNSAFTPTGSFSGAAGRVNSTVTPARQVQFGLKLSF